MANEELFKMMREVDSAISKVAEVFSDPSYKAWARVWKLGDQPERLRAACAAMDAASEAARQRTGTLRREGIPWLAAKTEAAAACAAHAAYELSQGRINLAHRLAQRVELWLVL